MQLAWSRIRTRVAVSISYDDNHYTTITIDRFIVMFGIESAPKNFWGKVYDWFKKRLFFLIVDSFLHFNLMDAQSLPVQSCVLFILLKVLVQTTSD